ERSRRDEVRGKGLLSRASVLSKKFRIPWRVSPPKLRQQIGDATPKAHACQDIRARTRLHEGQALPVDAVVRHAGSALGTLGLGLLGGGGPSARYGRLRGDLRRGPGWQEISGGGRKRNRTTASRSRRIFCPPSAAAERGRSGRPGIERSGRA